MSSKIKITENINFPYQENGYAHKCFPVRNIRRFKPSDGGAWLVEYKTEKERQLGNYADKKKIPKPQEKITKELTISYLINEFHLDDPIGLYSVNINGKQLHSVKNEDFSSFGNVLYFEAGDNRLTLETFKTFPRLEELHLQVNGITNIYVSHKQFLCLKRLDLSYNRLNDEALLNLGRLRNIKELTLRGCSLKHLHPELARSYLVSDIDGPENKSKAQEKSRFPELEHLDLSENKLTELSTFASLAGLRKLKTLNLSSNRICSVPHLRLIVSHRHFSASTCACKSPVDDALAPENSMENVIKSKEFCGIQPSIGVPSIPDSGVSGEKIKTTKVYVAEEIKVEPCESDETSANDTINATYNGEATTVPLEKLGDSDISDTDNLSDLDISVDECIDISNDANIDEIPTFRSENLDKALNEVSIVNMSSGTVQNTEDIKVMEGEKSLADISKGNDIINGIDTETENNISSETQIAGLNTVSSTNQLEADNLIDISGKISKNMDNELQANGGDDFASDTDMVNGVDQLNIDTAHVLDEDKVQEDISKAMDDEPLEGEILTSDLAREVNFKLDYFEEHDSPNSGDDVLVNNLKNPFLSLKMLDISDNLVSEQEGLLALISWPVLQDVKLWGNPLMQSYKGVPPVISHHLHKMCGINVHRKPPHADYMYNPIGPSIAKSVKTFRVKNDLPPIKKNTMLMIEAEISKAVEESERKEKSLPSIDVESKTNEDFEIKDNLPSEDIGDDTEGIFLTQVHEDIEVPESEPSVVTKQEIDGDAELVPKYKGYEELLKIDETYGPESDILVPSTVYGSVQALRHMLKNPLVLKEGNYNRKSRLNPDKQKKKTKSARAAKKNDVIEDALEFISMKETSYQENLVTVLDQFGKGNEMKEKFPDAKKLVKRVQEKYDKVRLESMRPISAAQTELSRMSTRADKHSQDLILLRMKQGRIGDLYSARNTSIPRSRVSTRNVSRTAP